jgi:hypothetical protein
MLKVAFIVPPNVELLDLAGPVQVLQKPNRRDLMQRLNFTVIIMKIYPQRGLLLARSKIIKRLT